MLSYHIYDVFTDTPFSGNPLSIVEAAEGLSTAQMQTIARQFNLSETIFVMPPDDPAHTAKVRIFFPTAEIPFAGHPTIGCALHLATATGASQITLEEKAGLVPVTISSDGSAEFTAPLLPRAHGAPPAIDLAAAALDLSPEDIGPHSPGTFQGGPAFAYIPVKSARALAQARPIEPHWSALMAQTRTDNAYLYVATDTGYDARMFHPTAGIPEDPATGSASAILAAQLMANGALGTGETRISLTQGVLMGRPSRIGLRVIVQNGQLASAHVSGRAVPVASGQIRIPRI